MANGDFCDYNGDESDDGDDCGNGNKDNSSIISDDNYYNNATTDVTHLTSRKSITRDKNPYNSRKRERSIERSVVVRQNCRLVSCIAKIAMHDIFD